MPVKTIRAAPKEEQLPRAQPLKGRKFAFGRAIAFEGAQMFCQLSKFCSTKVNLPRRQFLHITFLVFFSSAFLWEVSPYGWTH